MTINREHLAPCPFCGERPSLPSGDGTQYEIECECGMARAGVQICDLMSIEERTEDSFTDHRYAERFIERAKQEAVEQWNTRAQAAPEAEPVATSDVINHVFSRDRPVGWNAPEEEQASRSSFEEWLKTSRFSRPNSPWDIWKASAKALSEAAPQHVAELVELRALLNGTNYTASDDCHNAKVVRKAMARIDAKLATLRHV